jgi:hypothetical protein
MNAAAAWLKILSVVVLGGRRREREFSSGIKPAIFACTRAGRALFELHFGVGNINLTAPPAKQQQAGKATSFVGRLLFTVAIRVRLINELICTCTAQ